MLYQCILKNQTLLKLDIRHCNLPEALEKRLHQITKHRELKSRGISVDAYEKAEQQALGAWGGGLGLGWS